MLLTPRYGGTPVLRIDLGPDDPATPVLRQRRRLGALLAGLDEDQWSAPSRCDGWSVRDVIVHLVSTNQFWALSVSAGLAGDPTCFLATFDPVASPAELVAATRETTSSEVLARYDETVDALAAVLEDLEPAGWDVLAEAPPGHIAVRAVVAHALWDSLIHERDVVLPLGLEPVIEPDELALSLRYAAALGPAFQAAKGGTRCGTLAVEATEPDLSFVVEASPDVVVRDGPATAGAPCLRGRAIDLLEMLSFRVPFDHGLAAADRWLLSGVDEVFDLTITRLE